MMDFKEGAKLDVSLTPEELATLREHGLAVFRGKLILKAQPPITAEQLAEVTEPTSQRSGESAR